MGVKSSVIKNVLWLITVWKLWISILNQCANLLRFILNNSFFPIENLAIFAHTNWMVRFGQLHFNFLAWLLLADWTAYAYKSYKSSIAFICHSYQFDIFFMPYKSWPWLLWIPFQLCVPQNLYTCGFNVGLQLGWTVLVQLLFYLLLLQSPTFKPEVRGGFCALNFSVFIAVSRNSIHTLQTIRIENA